MARVGILTILDHVNYGNRLQNLAMQELLAGLGCRAETIRYVQSMRISPKDRLLEFGPVRRLNRCRRILLGLDSPEEGLFRARRDAVRAFNRKYIRMSRQVILADQVPAGLCTAYDWYVAGSDQVWNPHFMGAAAPLSSVAYLRFAPVDRRLAIAPSFGVAQLPPEAAEPAARFLREFRFLSVREEDGRTLIQQLTGLDCPVLPDPTLLVDQTLWEHLLEGRETPVPGGYVLTYFLGKVSPKRRAFIQKYATEKGFEVVWMNDMSSPDSYAWDPLKFLNAIKHCSAFFTDSFHGCVFSLVFRRQFFALRREGRTEDMSGRIATLLNMVGLEDRAVADGDPLPSVITPEQFEQVHQALAYRRAESTALLRDVLGEQG